MPDLAWILPLQVQRLRLGVQEDGCAPIDTHITTTVAGVDFAPTERAHFELHLCRGKETARD